MAINYKKEIIVRSIKILDIGYITAVYLLLGIILAKMCDMYFGDFNKSEEEKKPIWLTVIEIILYAWFIGIVVYFIRNIVPLIPFPLNGVYGFDHLKVKEVTSASAFLVTFVYFQENYQAKLKYLHSKLLSK
jgi:hypothetical protein